jgi:hypothetical protein
MDNMASGLENDSSRLMDIPVQTAELVNYEYKLTPSQNVQISAPEGDFDDCVCALALGAGGYHTDSIAALETRASNATARNCRSCPRCDIGSGVWGLFFGLDHAPEWIHVRLVCCRGLFRVQDRDGESRPFQHRFERRAISVASVEPSLYPDLAPIRSLIAARTSPYTLQEVHSEIASLPAYRGFTRPRDGTPRGRPLWNDRICRQLELGPIGRGILRASAIRQANILSVESPAQAHAPSRWRWVVSG